MAGGMIPNGNFPTDRRNDHGQDDWRIQTTRNLSALADRMTAAEAGVGHVRNEVRANTVLTAETNEKVDAIDKSLTSLTDSLAGVVKLSAHAATVGAVWKWLGEASFTLGKVAAGAGLCWAFFKYIVLEAIK